ncbi:succinylglutamate desuccinylase/aspartoacylase family protein [Ruegeria sp. HKCCSP346]|uniref:succinylglutamate desuccinylase/aspartoacylase family protein n=1 Tax=Ruegeria sp. HKCCSP346 TaxID=2794830 RepID=UPI001AE8CCA9|nr:succinylglutamate desuccinylase/aspartoacylase family protein [Ruegeria sp. HKCCSP346]
MREPFEIGGFTVPAGARATLDLPVSVMSDHTPVSMSVHVVHGRRPGPVLFVSAAIHGDEVIGVEIARRLLRAPQLEKIAGTLLVVPIVNAFGFMTQSRYLPDRRDLNRSFPGSEGGSLAGRLAHIFMTEIVERSDLGIDLHSAAIHRTNLPQIRVSPASDATIRYADAFGAPVVMISKLRDGSLRKAAQERGVDVLLFEGGEGLRFDELSARAGLAGILRVMNAMGMVARRGIATVREAPVHARTSSWVRAPVGGLLRTFKAAGEYVEVGDLLGRISDPFGEVRKDVLGETDGIIVGRTNLPFVHEGDALFHIAKTTSADVEMRIDMIANQLDGDPMFDEDEII